MDLYQLKTFFTFGKVCSFTETAKLMHISQSAISHSIKKLEISIGTTLVERKAKKLTLTRAGKELFKSCERIFYELEKTQESLDKLKKDFTGEVFIGSPVEFGTTILINHMKAFIDTNKNIKPDFLFSHNLSKALLSDEVDFIIDCKEHFLPNLERLFLFQEHYIIVASPAFIKENNIKAVSDLERVPILSLDKEAQWWDNFLVSIEATRRPQLKQVIQINHIRGLINGAIQGLGVSFVPRYTVSKDLSKGLIQNVFPKITPVADDFCIYIKKEKLALEKNKLLVDYLLSIRPSEFSTL